MSRTYLRDVVKPGDFVEYFPTVERFVLPEGLGVVKEHTFYPSEVKLWQVLTEKENVELIPTGSVGRLKVHGKEAYLNIGGILRKVCRNYINPDYALSATSLGAGLDEYDCLSFSELEAELEEGCPFYPFRDFAYVKDCSWFRETGVSLNGIVWFPSRTIREVKSEEEVRYFLMIRILTGTTVVERIMAEIPENSEEKKEYTEEFGVCPNVMLAHNIGVAGGDGTKENPYRLIRYPY
ncbi:MAG: hypothetical protein J6M02_02215 [Clostridia bacterium]|nr:hypothetical protein [Clostridia bacterium]